MEASNEPSRGFSLPIATAALVALVGHLAFTARAWAAEIVTLTLGAGEAYVIKNVDPGTAPAVSYGDNSNAFIVKSSGPRRLTVFTFQPGEGTVDTKVGGQDVTYHVVVRGVVNAMHPLRPGTAPPALSGAGSAETATPVPYAPASAAVVSGTRTAGAPGAASAPDAGSGPVATGPAPSGGEYAGGEGPTRTEVVGAAASRGSDYGAEYVGAGASPAGASATGTMNPNAGASTAKEWYQQPPSVVSQQFSTDPRALRPEGYVTNRAFGGRHNLPPDAITITSGTSQVYDFGGPISRVSVANTSVADVQVLGTHQVMLVGHKPGFSSLVVWDSQGNYVEREIWTEVAGHQQVMLHVTVAEVNLTKLEQMGIDISVALTHLGLTFVSLPGLVASPFTASAGATGPAFPPPGGTPLPLLFNQAMTYAIAGHNSNVTAFAFFQFLERHDLGRVLARPQLLANSGNKAKFLSGGEIPIVITQALTTTIVFKQFGTSVIFIPTVIGSRDIDLLVRPEVSKPDFTQGVQLFGFTVPAFITRRAETRVRLRDNQTLIIAGLILDDTRATIQKVPYLGDIPYAGSLFRKTYWNHNKTELVMSVTPELVRALPPGGEVAYPTEQQGPLTPEEVRTRPLAHPDVTRPRF